MDNNFPFSHFLKLDAINPVSEEKSNLLSNLVQTQVAESSPSNSLSMDELSTITHEIFNSLKLSISEQKFNTFFANALTVSRMDENKIEFATTTGLAKTMLEKYYLTDLQNAVLSTVGNKLEISIVALNAQTTGQNKKEEKTEIPYMVQRGDSVKNTRFIIGNDLHLNSNDVASTVESKVMEHMSAPQNKSTSIDLQKTFDTFIVGPSNNMAHAACSAVAEKPGQSYPSLYMYSGSGLGKTHLLHAVANKISELHPRLRICLTSSGAIMDDIVKATLSNKYNDLKKKYIDSVDVLMIDDIHLLRNKQGMQDFFFTLFNELHSQKKQLMFTSDKHPKDITGIEERVASRLSWGLVTDIQPPDFETRIAILKHKAAEQDLYLPDDVVTLIAGAIKGNIRELEGSLIRLGAFHSLNNMDIDIEIAKTELKLNETFNPDNISLESIAKSVSVHYKVSVSDIKSETRKKEITLARHVAMYLSYKIKQETTVSIGKFFGGRDHTTVIHAIDKIKREIQVNSELSMSINDIERSL